MEIISFTRLETAKFPFGWHSGEHLKRYVELKGMDSAIMNIESLQRCVGVVEGVCMLFVCLSARGIEAKYPHELLDLASGRNLSRCVSFHARFGWGPLTGM